MIQLCEELLLLIHASGISCSKNGIFGPVIDWFAIDGRRGRGCCVDLQREWFLQTCDTMICEKSLIREIDTFRMIGDYLAKLSRMFALFAVIYLKFRLYKYIFTASSPL